MVLMKCSVPSAPCRFHYASKKKASARHRAPMFSRSNYPSCYSLKATEQEEASARVVPSFSSIISKTAANTSAHHEEEEEEECY